LPEQFRVFEHSPRVIHLWLKYRFKTKQNIQLNQIQLKLPSLGVFSHFSELKSDLHKDNTKKKIIEKRKKKLFGGLE